MEIMICELKKEEIKDVQKIAKTSWNYTYKGIIPLKTQEKFLKSAYSDEMMLSRLENSLILIAKDNEKTVGFANFSPVRDSGIVELGAIYLLPEYFGMGIGTALLEYGIKHLKDVKEVFINVEKDNNIGLNFYKAKGFVVVSEFNDEFDGNILKTIRMALKV